MVLRLRHGLLQTDRWPHAQGAVGRHQRDAQALPELGGWRGFLGLLPRLVDVPEHLPLQLFGRHGHQGLHHALRLHTSSHGFFKADKLRAASYPSIPKESKHLPKALHPSSAPPRGVKAVSQARRLEAPSEAWTFKLASSCPSGPSTCIVETWAFKGGYHTVAFRAQVCTV